jgi:hypothetical protein
MEQYHAIGPVKYRIVLVPLGMQSHVLFESAPMILPVSATTWTNITVDLGLASGEDRGDVTQLAYSAGAGRDRL